MESKFNASKERALTIQKKSLISSLNTTKKAIVASAPLVQPTSGDSSVKMAKMAKMAKFAKLAKMAKMAKMAKFGKI